RLRVEVHRAHAIDELRELVDAPAMLGIRRRAGVIVADDAGELEPAEALADAGEQVLPLEVHALHGHFVLASARIELFELVTESLQRRFLSAERLSHALELLARGVEPLVRRTRGEQSLDAGFARREHA